jgi:hypothetical protein
MFCLHNCLTSHPDIEDVSIAMHGNLLALSVACEVARLLSNCGDGRERLETTCRYYLGIDHCAAKKVHEQFLIYAEPQRGKTLTPFWEAIDEIVTFSRLVERRQ